MHMQTYDTEKQKKKDNKNKWIKKNIYGLLMEPVKYIHDEVRKLFEVSRAFMLCGAQYYWA